MKTPLEKERQIILNTFDGLSKDYWKTLAEIAEVSSVKLEDVISIVFASGDFVENPYRQKYGQPIFTSRKVYRKITPFILKLMTAY
ncbi:MAG: hypothetical protein ACTHLD_03695 [Chitinophaga sp.]